MTDEIDPRILEIGFEANSGVKYFRDLWMTASGTKFANPLQDECTVKIHNLAKETRDYILTETSPFNKAAQKKRFIVRAGRESTGISQVFFGDIVRSSAAQPPDIAVELKSKTGDAQKGAVVSKSAPATQSLQGMATSIASDLGTTLTFEATDKRIASPSYVGPSLKQLDQLQDSGDVDVFLDGNNLVVKDANVPLKNVLRKLSKLSGMVGIPEWTDQGVKVKMLFDPRTVIGGGLQIESELNPAFNGLYVIFKLSFELSSRDVAWYQVAEAKRIGN